MIDWSMEQHFISCVKDTGADDRLVIEPSLLLFLLFFCSHSHVLSPPLSHPVYLSTPQFFCLSPFTCLFIYFSFSHSLTHSLTHSLLLCNSISKNILLRIISENILLQIISENILLQIISENILLQTISDAKYWHTRWYFYARWYLYARWFLYATWY